MVGVRGVVGVMRAGDVRVVAAAHVVHAERVPPVPERTHVLLRATHGERRVNSKTQELYVSNPALFFPCPNRPLEPLHPPLTGQRQIFD
jgi:hypothetical protein